MELGHRVGVGSAGAELRARAGQGPLVHVTRHVCAQSELTLPLQSHN